MPSPRGIHLPPTLHTKNQVDALTVICSQQTSEHPLNAYPRHTSCASLTMCHSGLRLDQEYPRKEKQKQKRKRKRKKGGQSNNKTKYIKFACAISITPFGGRGEKQ